jgi:polyhydroxyalkanoate synthase subunit PhaC
MVPGKIELKGEPLDLGTIKQDIYAVGAEKDHIVPWDAAWQITRLAGGKVRFILGSSGHIAGVINPPGGKGSYWVSEEPAKTASAWHKAATKHDGSWWTDWSAWLATRAGRKVKPPAMGSATHPVLVDAPGTYVLEK